MRVEAVRHALFSKADKNADGGSPRETRATAFCRHQRRSRSARRSRRRCDKTRAPTARRSRCCASSPASASRRRRPRTRCSCSRRRSSLHRWIERRRGRIRSRTRSSDPDLPADGGARRRGPAIPRSGDRASRSVTAVEGRAAAARRRSRARRQAAPRAGCRARRQAEPRSRRTDREGTAAGGPESAARLFRAARRSARCAATASIPSLDDAARDGADQPDHVQGAVGDARTGPDRRVPRGRSTSTRRAAASTSRSISIDPSSCWRRTAWRRARARRSSTSRWSTRWRA